MCGEFELSARNIQFAPAGNFTNIVKKLKQGEVDRLTTEHPSIDPKNQDKNVLLYFAILGVLAAPASCASQPTPCTNFRQKIRQPDVTCLVKAGNLDGEENERAFQSRWLKCIRAWTDGAGSLGDLRGTTGATDRRAASEDR